VNDITTTTLTTVENEIDDQEEALQALIQLIQDNDIEINTGFIPDEETGIYTHQVLRITCGEYVTVSQPEPLAIPLQPVGAPEGATVN
jgi:hypothetical protein